MKKYILSLLISFFFVLCNISISLADISDNENQNQYQYLNITPVFYDSSTGSAITTETTEYGVTILATNKSNKEIVLHEPNMLSIAIANENGKLIHMDQLEGNDIIISSFATNQPILEAHSRRISYFENSDRTMSSPKNTLPIGQYQAIANISYKVLDKENNDYVKTRIDSSTYLNIKDFVPELTPENLDNLNILFNAGLDWQTLETATQKLTDLVNANLNWTDLALMTNADIDWGDMQMMSDAGVDWEKVNNALENNENNEADQPAISEFTINLYKGWNVISVPFYIEGNNSSDYLFPGSNVFNTHSSYPKVQPIIPGEVYIIDSLKGDSIKIKKAKPFTEYSVKIKNRYGAYLTSLSKTATVKSEPSNAIYRVMKWDNQAQKYNNTTSLDKIEPGEAFYIVVNKNCQITVSEQ